jgi:hypothetical protein
MEIGSRIVHDGPGASQITSGGIASGQTSPSLREPRKRLGKISPPFSPSLIDLLLGTHAGHVFEGRGRAAYGHRGGRRKSEQCGGRIREKASR